MAQYIKDDRNIDIEVMNLILDSYRNIMNCKNAMFYNEGNTLIKTKETSNYMKELLIFYNRLNGYVSKRVFEPVKMGVFVYNLHVVRELFDEMIAHKHFDQKYTSLLNDTYEIIEALVVAAKIIQ